MAARWWIVSVYNKAGQGCPIRTLVLSRFVSQTMTMFTAKQTKEDLVVIKELIEAGKVTQVIDWTDPLSEVPEAIRYLEESHARGKVLITV